MRDAIGAALVAVGLIASSLARGSSIPNAGRTGATVPVTRLARAAPQGGESSGTVAPARAKDPVLDALNEMYARAWAAQDAKDHAGARALIGELIDRALAELGDRTDARSRKFLSKLGTFAASEGEQRKAEAVRRHVLEVSTRVLAEDDLELQTARRELALTLAALGDLRGARELEEIVLEVRSRLLSDDHAEVQDARQSLAARLLALGELERARALQEKVLEVRLRVLSEDDHAVQGARMNLAAMLRRLGETVRAGELDERVHDVFSRTLPDDDVNLQTARQNLAVTRYAQGDYVAARELSEQVLEVLSRKFPDEYPAVQAVRLNLGATLVRLGDLQGARALQERVLEVRSRTLPDDHPDLQMARTSLASTLQKLGDYEPSRELFAKVLEVQSRTLPEDHPHLLQARMNLGAVCLALGELEQARELGERALEVASRTLPEEHSTVQTLKQNLAYQLSTAGDFAQARALEEEVLAVRARTLPDDDPTVQEARQNLAMTITYQRARAMRDEVGASSDGATARQACAALIEAVCRSQTRRLCDALLAGSAREAEERCARLSGVLDAVLSYAEGAGVFERIAELEPLAFVLSETARGAAFVPAALACEGRSSARYGELRAELLRASEELARLAQRGVVGDAFTAARSKREAAERELVTLARGLLGERFAAADLDVATLASVLPPHGAAVAFRRSTRARIELVEDTDSTRAPGVREELSERMMAFVVRDAAAVASGDGAEDLVLVDLGPREAIDRAVEAWRAALGTTQGRGVSPVARPASASLDASADALRRLVFDPLSAALGDSTHLVLVLDDVLHLVPFDALPLGGEERGLLGDRLRIEVRSTLSELLEKASARSRSTVLVGVGDVRYEGEGEVLVASTSATPRPALLRGGAWSGGFTPLPGTRGEIEGIERCFVDAFGAETERRVLAQDEPTKSRILELAPMAGFFHVATHGWFAPESVPSWSDPEPLDAKSGLARRTSGEEIVKRERPMLLCGLALAGANTPEDGVGRAPGLLTADELSTVDLSNCELAVLSACDTNVGERRAGQGVASLQKALQMAGARSVITSLWKVPDEATKELMLDFYRRLWVEKKPKHQALWEAKTKLREAKNERGEPRYTTRDWAAWVLTGSPE